MIHPLWTYLGLPAMNRRYTHFIICTCSSELTVFMIYAKQIVNQTSDVITVMVTKLSDQFAHIPIDGPQPERASPCKRADTQ